MTGQPVADPAAQLRAAVPGVRVLVVGSLNADLLISLDRMPDDDGSAPVAGVHESFGGHAGNCASALAALGARATLVAAVGDDDTGAAVLADLRGRGVDLAPVHVAAARTGRVFVISTPAYRCMLMERAANDLLPPEALAGLDPGAYSVVVVFDPAAAVVAAVPGWARRARPAPLLCWNPGGTYSTPASRTHLDAYDLVVVNRAEFAGLFGAEPDAGPAPGDLAGWPRAGIVLTRGPAGSRLHTADGVVDVPAPEVTARDATGAGDAFCAGLLAARAAGLGARDALRFGNAVGALATRRPGARGALPTLAEALTLACGGGPETRR